jgi:dihydrofolate reductase
MGNCLIVNFPSTPFYDRNAIAEEKSVSFSTHSNGLYIKYPPNHERSLRWYSSEDRQGFHHQMIQDAVVAWRKMTDLWRLTFQDDYVCLEHLVSRDVEEVYIAMRIAMKKHVVIVLAEQRAQCRHRRVSVDDLAKVSSRSSQVERERTRKIGILVALIA